MVRCDELTLAIGMAYRIHRPSDMMVEEHTDGSPPEEAIPASDQVRDYKAQERPKHESVADEDHQFILEEGPGIALHIGSEVIENPANMSMEEAFDGAMRIFILIRVGMVLDMGGRPVQSRTLEGHRTTDQEEGTDPIRSFKAFVGKHPMIADRDAELSLIHI